jgi:hypothetical protein
MHINRLASSLFIVAGIVLLILGFSALDSFGSDVSRFFTGAPTDKAVWMMIGGLVALAVGTSGVFIGRSKS